MLRQDNPESRRLLILAASTVTRGLPSRFPFTLALRSPARTRSAIKLRSSSANERLAWHFDKPLVVIEHGKLPPSAASDPMAKLSEAVFHVLQKDLANRSKHGQVREAKTSGHYIQRDQPELVTKSIRDVIRESATLITAKPRR